MSINIGICNTKKIHIKYSGQKKKMDRFWNLITREQEKNIKD